GGPDAVLHRVNHHQSQHGDQNHHYEQDTCQRCETTERTDLVARHLAQRPSVTPERVTQNHEILYAAAENGADHDPYGGWQIAELGCEHRADQRSRACNGREMMAKRNPSGGRHIVAAIIETYRRGD